jgi:hypothetical protein
MAKKEIVLINPLSPANDVTTNFDWLGAITNGGESKYLKWGYHCI